LISEMPPAGIGQERASNLVMLIIKLVLEQQSRCWITAKPYL
jgi:hypothetical protein